MPTYRIDVEYEGTRYSGWQEQRNARSIAGELRRAFEAAGAVVVELGGSGRTDAGVHALQQSAHLRLREPCAEDALRLAVNDRLPADVHVLTLRRAADDFHARHDAVARSYLYQVARRRTALGKRAVWWIKRPLDVVRLDRAAQRLAGRHDFRLLCEQPAAQPSTIVVVERVEVAEEGALILVRLVASHFLWKMVRRVVGVLVRVAAGEMEPAEVGKLLDPATAAPARGEEGVARWTAPPSGLFLERVLYPGEPGLGPLRAAVAVAAEVPVEPPYLGRRPHGAGGRTARAARGPGPRRRGRPSGRSR